MFKKHHPSKVFCQQVEEDIEHAFFTCAHVRKVWTWFGNWIRWGKNIPSDFRSLMENINSGSNDRKTRKLHKALAYTVLWTIWKSRNEVVFKNGKANAMQVADEIQLSSFNWVKYRSRCNGLN
ncbi:hypothetical protein LXL04_006279 [Taraxacum kok-saghyz]